MKDKFVIITLERTGSNYLCELLDNCPDVTCHREIFHSDAIYWNGGKLDSAQDLSNRNANPIKFMDDVYESVAANHAGFKLFIYHNEDVLRHLSDRKDIRVVYLYRNNKLAQYSSRLIAILTSQWVSSDENGGRTQKIRWDEADYREFESSFSMMEKHFFNLFDRETIFPIEYKDLFEGSRVDDLFSYLGMSGQAPVRDVSLRKQNPKHVLERFENPEEVEKYLRSKGLMDWRVD